MFQGAGTARQAEFPVLTGPYLGQKPPGATPELFAPGIVSRPEFREFSGAFTPDGREYYFFRFADGAGMMVTKLTPAGWTEPKPAPFDTEYIDNEPHVTPGGRRLFFCSNRPYPGSGEGRRMTQVWFMERQGDDWGEPKHLGTGMFPTMSASGLITIGSAQYALTDDGLKEVGALEYDPAVPQSRRLVRQHTCMSPDESFHLFDFDERLYVCFRTKQGTWGAPADLSQRIDLPEGEMLPTLSPDRRYLFFCNRGDIYWVSAKIIDEAKPMAGEPGPKSAEVPGGQVPKLSDKLSVFEPYLGPTWAGSIPDDSRMGEITLKWDVLLNGFAVRLRRNVLKFDHWLETTCYWDVAAEKIAFLALSNNGVVLKGFAFRQGDGLVFEGDQHGPDIDRKSRRIYKMDKDGTLYEDDQFRTPDAAEWRRTHVSVFVARKVSDDRPR
jgi:hypothetical protein